MTSSVDGGLPVESMHHITILGLPLGMEFPSTCALSHVFFILGLQYSFHVFSVARAASGAFFYDFLQYYQPRVTPPPWCVVSQWWLLRDHTTLTRQSPGKERGLDRSPAFGAQHSPMCF